MKLDEHIYIFIYKMLIIMLFLKNGNNLLNYFINIYGHNISVTCIITEFLLYKRRVKVYVLCVVMCDVSMFS